MRIALIGSRKLEHHPDKDLYYNVCYRLACLGITMTSGLATGADSIAQEAYAKAIVNLSASYHQLEVYIASERSRIKSKTSYKDLAIIAPQKHKQATYALCEQLIPHWSNCNEYARSLHGRNCHQILGYDLNQPVDAVICWTPEGAKVGGTRTAILLAESNSIPVFNLGNPDKDAVLEDIKNFLITNELI